MDNKINFLSSLIECKSITPYDHDCQKIITEFLVPLGFEIQSFKKENVSNLLAIRSISKPVFAFVGHTDVVSAEPLEKWDSDPFNATIKDNHIYGRGAADMKGNLTAFLFAVKQFINKYPTYNGSICILITSGEECDECHNGIPTIVKKLPFTEIDYCLVGEPTSTLNLGDTIKVGRRGSLSANLEIKGKGGHIAYPKFCTNPFDSLPDVINEIAKIKWNDKDEIFDETNLEFTNTYTFNKSGNVIPDSIFLNFNLRYNPNTSLETIKESINNAINKHSSNYKINWTTYGLPYKSKENKLFSIASQAVYDIANITPNSSTSGGTSDGRYIADNCNNIIELGCSNSSIHKPNENIKIQDLDNLETIYYKILENTIL
ncbi:MAG: succinyl-diaminopimelate desuccinylase [Legionellales bacterium]|nr:succinyl-diaminopimelate desuccinylase [Legionellales bacterium]